MVYFHRQLTINTTGSQERSGCWTISHMCQNFPMVDHLNIYPHILILFAVSTEQIITFRIEQSQDCFVFLCQDEERLVISVTAVPPSPGDPSH